MGRVPEEVVARVVDAGVGQSDGAIGSTADEGIDVGREQCLARSQRDLQHGTRNRRASELRIDVDLPPLERRLAAQDDEACGGHHLEPDRLPDSGGPPVPNGVRLELPILLATGFGEIMRIIEGAHRDDVLAARAKKAGDVDFEGRVSARMPSDHRLVDPHRRLVVDRAEVENDAFLLGVRRS
jgi:hypothetical protein